MFAQTETAPAAGDGSEGTPYQIATLDNLYWLSQNSSEWGKYFVQTANINASSTSGWDSGAGFSPIGNLSTYFSGHYDGNNKTISGLFINRSGSSLVGFFGKTSSAVIENLALINVNITGGNLTGALVGSAVGYFYECYSSGTVTGTSNVGGLIGLMDYYNVIDCYSRATVSGTEGRLPGDAGWQLIASHQTHPGLKGHGNTSSRRDYEFLDVSVESVATYRYQLSDVDTKGNITILDVLGITLEEADIPEKTELQAASPNPFNPQTKISYQLAVEASVVLSVYDVQGRIVSLLIDGTPQSPGSYSIHWNGKDDSGSLAASGTYILRLIAGETEQSQKVLLMR